MLLAPLSVATPAVADTVTSDNWSGYAVHGAAQTFRQVGASWREPAASCTAGTDTYSSFWVGIGGYRASSDGLEQVGSEVDCAADGGVVLSAWYELVPAPARTIRMTIAPGDLLSASVSIAGRAVTMTITDESRHEGFAKTIVDRTLDLTSAEWIAEAPSDCTAANVCHTLPLADFGSVRFTRARAVTTAGRVESIGDLRRRTTRIEMKNAASGRVVSDVGLVTATPSALTDGGHAFRIAVSGAPSPSGPSSGGSAPGPLQVLP